MTNSTGALSGVRVVRCSTAQAGSVPFMLMAGFITPLPYNYWRLKALGKACH